MAIMEELMMTGRAMARPEKSRMGTNWMRWLAGKTDVRQQSQALRDLDDRLLSDAGVTRDDAQREAARTVRDAPARWRMPMDTHRVPFRDQLRFAAILGAR